MILRRARFALVLVAAVALAPAPTSASPAPGLAIHLVGFNLPDAPLVGLEGQLKPELHRAWTPFFDGVASGDTFAPKSIAGAVIPGNAGRFADLDAKAVVGDRLTPHHMPQAAAKFTPREEGGALVLPHEEHILTRTYGAAGRRIAREEIGLSFRAVLARDVRDIRRIAGVKYNEGLRLLLEYYRRYYPEVINKPPKTPGQ